MQSLGVDIVKQVKRIKLKKLEEELREGFKGSSNGERCECPLCHYSSKKNKMSAVVFNNPNGKTLKCFSCGEWRRLE